ncbi:chloroplastic group IIA intron splicing facilitator CRS1, chloroplastic [Andrographis paniculata]|uniref:chloroplastic group IIA intron splicing facilitator CRS1, chloroplastic n=1 Tax=Andrographis paniculata TaxID=175694 RepID=UPI0021E94776|nr:chloroplastic group IIA intron splicing facilitator CRS1, chloroplastic [Andrographis paniculata]XP_051127463.1 chloroplastic group IIA intron splicing facilitator CRS1, chloroplastic [Andrographis paniculata]XP_051127464.1 chloroplastic group IIA intron splicing facilitator CRS1, chloroplastic [Andrographis paniculata]XP_051127465.1 chloroplastic group IIA intron splicing facilitator CRS1, chloroplastic [Andrographis paniculata]
MSTSPFLSYLSLAISPFPANSKKNQFHFISLSPSNFSLISCSSVSASGSNGADSRTVEFDSQDVYTKPSQPNPHSSSRIKAPTAPWMNEPLLVKPNEVVDFSRRRKKKDFTTNKNHSSPDVALTGKVGGGRGRIAMKQILKGIEKLQGTLNSEEIGETQESANFKFAPGDLCGNADYNRRTKLDEISEEAQDDLERSEFNIPFTEIKSEGGITQWPWKRNEKMVIPRVRPEKVVTAAELSLDGVLLDRLKGEAATIKKWVKVKKAGVTQAVVDQVRFIWRNDELALINFDVPLCRNMRRAREIVEMKTGGVVVWRNKDFLAVYRGCNYQAGVNHASIIDRNCIDNKKSAYSPMNFQNATNVTREGSVDGSLDEMADGKYCLSERLHTVSLYEREADRLLDGLGPRFVDWWMSKPLPVDADLLPETVPGFKTPFRLCPPSTRSKLTDAELTYLRKLAHPLPTHFVLGRNWKLQGLAAAIIKMWEKCHIAKIALKWGIPNTDNESMAYELKKLTGGVLLLRNKYLIILYRGKDFLPSEVAKVVAEREIELTRCQLQEEAARLKASKAFPISDEHTLNPGIVGTLSEFRSVISESRNLDKGKTEAEVGVQAEKERLEKELKVHQRRLSFLKKKMRKSAKILEKLKNSTKSSDKDPDPEIISDEERACMRQMGLKIDSSLVLGRRGIYDGVIEGIHQHWKHKEIVKVITMQRTFSQVMYTARRLETETGGILVSVVKLKEGHAIIVYRGKNYKRPKLAAPNLLSKREALSRSLEIQRFGSLKFFASQKEQAISDLKCKLAELLKKMN